MSDEERLPLSRDDELFLLRGLARKPVYVTYLVDKTITFVSANTKESGMNNVDDTTELNALPGLLDAAKDTIKKQHYEDPNDLKRYTG